MSRPTVVLAMVPALTPDLFDEELWARLRAIAEVPDAEPLTTFEEPRALEWLPQIALGRWVSTRLALGAGVLAAIAAIAAWSFDVPGDSLPSRAHAAPRHAVEQVLSLGAYMRRGYSRWTALGLLLAVASVVEAQTPTVVAPPPLVIALRTHRDYLRALALGKIGMDRIIALLDGPIDDDMPSASRDAAVSGVAMIGVQAWGSWSTTGFIEDETATRVLAAGLLDPDHDVRASACSELQLGKDTYLGLVADEIKASAPKLPRECGAWLLGRLSLPLSEASELLGRPLDSWVRARLGDSSAHATLLEGFRKASDFKTKERAALALGYVGTQEAGNALVKALHSPIIHGHGVGDRVSVRIPIIEALGRIHQNEILLSSSILRIRQIGDQGFGGPTAIAEYLDGVYAWAEATYGVAPEGPDPGPFLMDIENSPVMH